MEDFSKGVTYTWGRIRYLIAMWVTVFHRPFSIIDDTYFHAILQMLYPRVRLPSQFTVSCNVRTIMQITKGELILMFKVNSFCSSVTTRLIPL